MKHNLYEMLHMTGAGGKEEDELERSWQQHVMERMKDLISLRLTGRQKEIIMLYYYEGLSQREIAKRLGISESAVSHTKKRACKKLEYAMNLMRR